MMKIITMDIGHVPAVARLEEVCFHDPWSINAITSEVTNPLSLWLVALVDEQVVGYVGSQSVIDQADVMNLAVDPVHRRRGVAQCLMERLEDELKACSICSLMLEVRASNEPAKALYEKLGFSVAGRRPGYYIRPKEDALIMRKELET